MRWDVEEEGPFVRILNVCSLVSVFSVWMLVCYEYITRSEESHGEDIAERTNDSANPNF